MLGVAEAEEPPGHRILQDDRVILPADHEVAPELGLCDSHQYELTPACRARSVRAAAGVPAAALRLPRTHGADWAAGSSCLPALPESHRWEQRCGCCCCWGCPGCCAAPRRCPAQSAARALRPLALSCVFLSFFFPWPVTPRCSAAPLVAGCAFPSTSAP